MNDSVELWRTDGHFWLGHDEAHPISGSLIYFDNGKCHLELKGIFGAEGSNPFNICGLKLPPIYGKTKKFRSITLLKGIENGRSLYLDGENPHESIVSTRQLLTSTVPHDFDVSPVLMVKAVLMGLEKWLGISGFTLNFGTDFHGLKVNFELPDAITFNIENDFDVAFGFGYQSPSITWPQTEVSIKQIAYLEIITHNPKPLEDIRRVLQKVIDLISLAVSVPLYVIELEAKFAIPSSAANGQWAKVWVERHPVIDKIPHSMEMLLPFPEVRGRFQSMLNAWMSSLENIEPTYQLYFATIRSSTMYVQHRLFNLFQALESYHRRAIESDVEEKKKIIERREKIISIVAGEDQQWLSDKLVFCHEPSASQRIKELAVKLDAQWIFGDKPDSVVQRIANVRNYLTHYGADRKPPDEDLKIARMMNFSSMLQVLCESVFLHSIGLTHEDANKLLREKRRLEKITFSED